MTVHVMAEVDHPIEIDASVCTERRPGGSKTDLVYHPSSALFGDHWVCEVCGEGAHRNGAPQ